MMMLIDYQLHDVPNDDLIVQLKRLVGSSNELTAQLLAHLAEVDGRGLYRSCACATLYTYCVYELRLSEDEAQRRCRAARVARQFPRLLDMLAEGSIHLTGILLLAPHLTQENHEGLLARARYRTKREIEKLVADLAPCADAPSLIQPLGRAPAAPGRPAATWAALVRGWAGPVRQLAPGDGYAQVPMGELGRRVAYGDADEAPSSHASRPASEETAPARGTIDSSVLDGGQARSAAHVREAGGPWKGNASSAAPERESSAPDGVQPPSAAPERESSAPDGLQPRGVQRYKVQFTADQSYVELLERARDLLQHEVFDRDLARVHRLALEALLEKLSKRKYAGRAAEKRAVEKRAVEKRDVEKRDVEQRAAEQRDAEQRAAEQRDVEHRDVEHRDVEHRAAEQRDIEHRALEHGGAEQRGIERKAFEQGSAEQPSAEVAPTFTPARTTQPAQPASTSTPVARVDAVTPGAGGRVEPSRHIPAHIKRAVWERDGARCTFTDARGQRCRETALLEFHHREAYAKGGPDEPREPDLALSLP